MWYECVSSRSFDLCNLILDQTQSTWHLRRVSPNRVAHSEVIANICEALLSNTWTSWYSPDLSRTWTTAGPKSTMPFIHKEPENLICASLLLLWLFTLLVFEELQGTVSLSSLLKCSIVWCLRLHVLQVNLDEHSGTIRDWLMHEKHNLCHKTNSW